jgi:hypothetical protein
LLSSSSDDDDEIPLAKRAKLFFEKTESAKESNPSPAAPTLCNTPFFRTCIFPNNLKI